MSQRTLTFSQEEFEWVKHAVERLAIFARKHPFALKNADQVIKLDEKLSAVETVDKDEIKQTYDVDSLKVLKQVVGQGRDALEKQVIPSYKKRMNGPLAAKKYKIYLQRAEVNLKRIKRISEEMEKVK